MATSAAGTGSRTTMDGTVVLYALDNIGGCYSYLCLLRLTMKGKENIRNKCRIFFRLS